MLKTFCVSLLFCVVHALPVWAQVEIPSSVMPSPIESDSVCYPLNQYFKTQALDELTHMEGPSFVVRTLIRPSNRFSGLFDIVVILGETHIKECSLYQKGERFLKNFRHIALEDATGIDGQDRGGAYVINVDISGIQANDQFSDIRKKFNLCGTQEDAAEQQSYLQHGKSVIYFLEGSDAAKPLNWKESLARSVPTTVQLIPKIILGIQNHSGENERQIVLKSFNALPAEVRALENEQLAAIKRTGKIQARNGIDVRSKIMAQNIGLIFARSGGPIHPLLAIMGGDHVPNVKFQLMLYQGFREIRTSRVQSCLKLFKQFPFFFKN